MEGMSRKNQQRIDQFLDPVKRGLLLNLPRTLMAEALELLAVTMKIGPLVLTNIGHPG